MSPLLSPPFTYREGALHGQQLRTFCLETELEKRKKDSGVSMSMSVSRVKEDSGDRVEDRQICFLYVTDVLMGGGTEGEFWFDFDLDGVE